MLEVLYLSTPQRKHPSPEIKKNLDVVEGGGGEIGVTLQCPISDLKNEFFNTVKLDLY